jgi:hypothetical protein
MEADVVFGEYAVIARMATIDLEKLQNFVSDKVRTVPNVLMTSYNDNFKRIQRKNLSTKKQVAF